MRGGKRLAGAAWTTAALILLAAVVLVVALPGRPPVAGGAASSILDGNSLTIGVKPDQPGLSWRRPDGTFEGFDIDVALYIAGRLGVRRDRVRFQSTPSSERERVLRDGTADMVISTYSITPERWELVTFAGPYYVAHQDILVRAGDGSIRTVRDLDGRRLCQVGGSNSWRRVTEERRVGAERVPAASYSECVTLLVNGDVDAVSTDDLILAGFAGTAPSDVEMVNAPFTNERYGVGLRKGDLEGCEQVNRILTEMYQNGTAETLLGQWFGAVDLDVTETVPEFAGCP